jgi:hypothetical protein
MLVDSNPSPDFSETTPELILHFPLQMRIAKLVEGTI